MPMAVIGQRHELPIYASQLQPRLTPSSTTKTRLQLHFIAELRLRAFAASQSLLIDGRFLRCQPPSLMNIQATFSV